MNSTEQLTQEIESAIPALMQRIKEETLLRVEREASQAATAVAVDAAKKWAEEVLAPEVAAQLAVGKSGFIAAAEDAAKRIGETLSDALVEQVKKSLASSYVLKEVTEKLMRGY